MNNPPSIVLWFEPFRGPQSIHRRCIDRLFAADPDVMNTKFVTVAQFPDIPTVADLYRILGKCLELFCDVGTVGWQPKILFRSEFERDKKCHSVLLCKTMIFPCYSTMVVDGEAPIVEKSQSN